MLRKLALILMSLRMSFRNTASLLARSKEKFRMKSTRLKQPSRISNLQKKEKPIWAHKSSSKPITIFAILPLSPLVCGSGMMAKAQLSPKKWLMALTNDSQVLQRSSSLSSELMNRSVRKMTASTHASSELDLASSVLLVSSKTKHSTMPAASATSDHEAYLEILN